MKSALTSVHRNVPVRMRRRAVTFSRISRTLATLAVLSATIFSINSRADESPVTITILLYNYAEVPLSTVAIAEGEASKILASAGAQVEWVHCPRMTAPNASELCRGGWTPQMPGLRLITGTNKFRDAEFAHTSIPVLVTVYYEKVLRRAQRDNSTPEVPVLLGCVMAHELGHLLLQSPSHSSRGIMQPQWSAMQIRQMFMGKFQFSHEEAIRIQSQARILASLPRSTAQQSVAP